jgi:hypothetical protein
MAGTPSSLRLALAACVAVLATGCANRVQPLYLWESFPRQQYDTLLTHGSPSQDQILALQAHAEKARASNAALPPGFRAHLGMLQLAAGNIDEARALWQAEKASFPESAPYMDQLLKRLDGPTAAKKGNPA